MSNSSSKFPVLHQNLSKLAHDNSPTIQRFNNKIPKQSRLNRLISSSVNDKEMERSNSICSNIENNNISTFNEDNINTSSNVKPKTSLKKCAVESLLNHPIKEEKNFKSKIPEYLFCLISEDDKIFDDYGKKYKEMHKGLDLFKSFARKKNKPVTQTDPLQKLLAKIYKSDYNFKCKLKQAKKQKNLDLENYQKNLVSTIAKALTKDSIQRLSQTMRELKFEANNVRNFENKNFIRDIEDKEYEIIKNLQRSEEQLKKLRVAGKINQIQLIPAIKFKKISKD